MDKKLQNYEVGGKKKDITMLISKFKFVSKMKKGEKIDVDDMTMVGSGWLDRLMRHYNNNDESRNKTLVFIEELYVEGGECASALAKENDVFYREMGSLLINEMKNAKGDSENKKTGVVSLMETYSRDKMFVSKVETFIEVINTKITHLEELYAPRENAEDLKL